MSRWTTPRAWARPARGHLQADPGHAPEETGAVGLNRCRLPLVALASIVRDLERPGDRLHGRQTFSSGFFSSIPLVDLSRLVWIRGLVPLVKGVWISDLARGVTLRIWPLSSTNRLVQRESWATSGSIWILGSEDGQLVGDGVQLSPGPATDGSRLPARTSSRAVREVGLRPVGPRAARSRASSSTTWSRPWPWMNCMA